MNVVDYFETKEEKASDSVYTVKLKGGRTIDTYALCGKKSIYTVLLDNEQEADVIRIQRSEDEPSLVYVNTECNIDEEAVLKFLHDNYEEFASYRLVKREKACVDSLIPMTRGMERDRYDFIIGSTTDTEIQNAIEKHIDIVSYIKCAIETNLENDSIRLLSIYEEADETERAIMDLALINICGFTMASVIKEAEEEGYLLKD